jgi:hypothetical protein
MTNRNKKTALLASIATSVAAMLMSANAMAADLAPAAPAPTAEEAIGAASPWMLRVRGLGVITHDSGSVDGVLGAGLSYSDTVNSTSAISSPRISLPNSSLAPPTPRSTAKACLPARRWARHGCCRRH